MPVLVDMAILVEAATLRKAGRAGAYDLRMLPATR